MSTDFLVVKNRAGSTLASGMLVGDLSLTASAGEGALFPSTYPFDITIEKNDTAYEIVQCTNRTADIFTIVRAQQGTSAVTHDIGETVQLRITAKSIADLNTAVNSLETLTNSMSCDAVTGDVTVNANVILEGLEFTEDASEVHFLDSLGFYGRDTEQAVRIGSERVDAGTLIPFLAGLDVDVRSLRIQDYYGGTGMAFNVIDVIPVAAFFGFDLYGYSAFSIREPVTGVGETSLGCAFSAIERDSGASPIAFVLQSDFGGHRFQIGDVGANCNHLPTFEFAVTGGYDDVASEENPRFVFQAQDTGAGEWWIRAYPKPVDSGWAEAFDPLGFMFGDGASLKGLHSGDVVITPTSAYGAPVGGNLEVQNNSYLGELLVRADGTMQPASMADASAVNNSIYYSTTQGKLVYKDAAGGVNNLY